MQRYHVHLLTSTNESLQLQNYILLKLAKHIIVFLSTKPKSNSWKNNILEGKIILEHKCILNPFNHMFSANCKGRWFFIIRSPKSSKNYFCCKPFFLKGSFTTKKLDMELLKIFDLFFACYLSSFFKGLFTSSSIFKKIIEWSTLTCFLNATIPLVVLYIINPLLAWVFGFKFKIKLL